MRESIKMLFNGKRVYKNAFLYQVNFHDTESALFVSRIVGKSVCVFIFETGMDRRMVLLSG